MHCSLWHHRCIKNLVFSLFWWYFPTSNSQNLKMIFQILLSTDISAIWTSDAGTKSCNSRSFFSFVVAPDFREMQEYYFPVADAEDFLHLSHHTKPSQTHRLFISHAKCLNQWQAFIDYPHYVVEWHETVVGTSYRPWFEFEVSTFLLRKKWKNFRCYKRWKILIFLFNFRKFKFSS